MSFAGHAPPRAATTRALPTAAPSGSTTLLQGRPSASHRGGEVESSAWLIMSFIGRSLACVHSLSVPSSRSFGAPTRGWCGPHTDTPTTSARARLASASETGLADPAPHSRSSTSITWRPVDAATRPTTPDVVRRTNSMRSSPSNRRTAVHDPGRDDGATTRLTSYSAAAGRATERRTCRCAPAKSRSSSPTTHAGGGGGGGVVGAAVARSVVVLGGGGWGLAGSTTWPDCGKRLAGRAGLEGGAATAGRSPREEERRPTGGGAGRCFRATPPCDASSRPPC